MPSTQSYLEYVLDQLSDLKVTYRKMMGEYILYYNGKVVGGIYDDRLLIKPTPSALSLVPTAPLSQPYPNAKPMLLVSDIDDSAFLKTLIQNVFPD